MNHSLRSPLGLKSHNVDQGIVLQFCFCNGDVLVSYFFHYINVIEKRTKQILQNCNSEL